MLLLLACVRVHVVEGSQSLDESVVELVAGVPSGSLEAGGDLTGGAEITWKLTYDQAEPFVSQSVDAGVLSLSADCGFNAVCMVDFFVATAPDVNMTLDILDGPVVVHGVSGRVSVASAKGSVTLDRLSGEVEIGAAEGDVIGSALSSPVFIAGGQKGDHLLQFDATPTSVDSSTQEGNISLTVPSGTYAITTESPEAPTISGLTDDDTAANSLLASTGAGTITLTGE
jgi:hypothetical protein